MRIDHIAYQRATRVAGFGFFLQLAMGIVLLVFALVTGDAGDTAFRYGALYVLCGTLVWLSLIVIFHQHKLERLEALEEDELTANREGAGSIFDRSGDEIRVAARRLEKMYKWLMPAASLLLAVVLALLAWWMIARLRAFDLALEAGVDIGEFARTPDVGWGVAVALAFAAISFIFSRFVAGMAKHEAWQNLRGGAAYMVGNALVLLAIAVGMIFRFFETPEEPSPVIEGVAFAIPIVMFVMAAEISINFVLNIYRPRVVGETPRPAFDSKLLSYFSAPDSLVRSINEAVNYQFGFDVTSTWGYQLLMRSLIRLFVIGFGVMLILSMLVVVEPHEQAVKLSRGKIVDDRVHDSGLMWKLPWPLQTASIHDVSRIRDLPLTARRTRIRPVNVWTQERDKDTDREIEPFLVGSSRFDIESVDMNAADAVGLNEGDDGLPDREADPAEVVVSRTYALLDAEISLQYRIKADGGLLDYLLFAGNEVGRTNVRLSALRDIALREVSLQLSKMRLDEILARERETLSSVLRDQVQAAYDRYNTGVEIVAVNIPLLRPAGGAVRKFEDFSMASQDLEQIKAKAEGEATKQLSYLAGDTETAEEIVTQIDRYDALLNDRGIESSEVIEQRGKVETSLLNSGGLAGVLIGQAYTDRWVKLLDARRDAVRVQSQLGVYRAAPELYRQREMMRVFMENLGSQRRYILGIDPSRVHIDVELKEVNPVLDFESSLGEGTE